jgi:hypothetical protein
MQDAKNPNLSYERRAEIVSQAWSAIQVGEDTAAPAIRVPRNVEVKRFSAQP